MSILFLCFITQIGFTQNLNRPPNVIVILADDLGYGDVSSYNENAAFTTSNIDKLAEQGMLFTDAHTSASICSPTRYGIMTGRYNWRSTLKRSGLHGYSKPLINRGRMTIANLFKDQGYKTAMIGKWHLGWDWAIDTDNSKTDSESDNIDFSKPIKQGPVDYGFEYFYGLGASLSSPPYVYIENDLATAIPSGRSVNHDDKAYWKEGPIAPDFNHAKTLGHLMDKTLSYIKSASEQEMPYFLYCALTAPHAPIVPTTEYIGSSNTNFYGDFVLMVDHVVGRIMAAIKESPHSENTLVIFTSDNGQSPRTDFDGDELSKAGHNGSYIFRGMKFDIFEGGHRVPFIVSWPNKIKGGRVCDETVSSVDIMATASELLEVKLPDTVAEDSYSFLPILKGAPYEKPLREATIFHSSDGRFAIRKGERKLILWPGSGGWTYPKTKEEMQGLPKFQLYNLNDDPSEKNNLIHEYSQRAIELKLILRQYILNGRSTPGVPQENDGPRFWPELGWMDQ